MRILRALALAAAAGLFVAAAPQRPTTRPFASAKLADRRRTTPCNICC